MKLKKAITDRLAPPHQNVKNEIYTVGHMLREFNARVYTPQRLLSISFAEKKKSADGLEELRQRIEDGHI